MELESDVVNHLTSHSLHNKLAYSPPPPPLAHSFGCFALLLKKKRRVRKHTRDTISLAAPDEPSDAAQVTSRDSLHTQPSSSSSSSSSTAAPVLVPGTDIPVFSDRFLQHSKGVCVRVCVCVRVSVCVCVHDVSMIHAHSEAGNISTTIHAMTK